MRAVLPVEQLASHTGHPFQQGFARQASRLIPPTEVHDLQTVPAGLLIAPTLPAPGVYWVVLPRARRAKRAVMRAASGVSLTRAWMALQSCLGAWGLCDQRST